MTQPDYKSGDLIPAVCICTGNIKKIFIPKSTETNINNFDRFGSSSEKPFWVIKVGSKIDIELIQAILAVCLKHSNDIWNIQIMTTDDLSDNERFYIGSFTTRKHRPMERSEQFFLINSELRISDLLRLLPDGNWQEGCRTMPFSGRKKTAPVIKTVKYLIHCLCYLLKYLKN